MVQVRKLTESRSSNTKSLQLHHDLKHDDTVKASNPKAKFVGGETQIVTEFI